MQFSEKTMENVRKHRDIKFGSTAIWKEFLVLEPNYHTAKTFTKEIISDGNEKNKNYWISLFI